MEQLSNTISSIIENIEPLIVELASALGTTVEFVEQNFMFYLIEFGKYQAFIRTPGNLLSSILIASFLGFGIFLLIDIYICRLYSRKSRRYNSKRSNNIFNIINYIY